MKVLVARLTSGVSILNHFQQACTEGCQDTYCCIPFQVSYLRVEITTLH